MRFRIFILSLIVLWSCESANTKNEGDVKNQSDFEQYISTLDKIPLPLELNPLIEMPRLSQSYDKIGFEKFKHVWTSYPLGVFYANKETVAIIDCGIGDWGPVPFLTTYNLSGVKIDSTGFYQKSGQDIGYNAIEYVTFNLCGKVSSIDTVHRWEVDEVKMDIVEGTKETMIGQTSYEILENGKIKKKASR